jgi:hypothetical protein
VENRSKISFQPKSASTFSLTEGGAEVKNFNPTLLKRFGASMSLELVLIASKAARRATGCLHSWYVEEDFKITWPLQGQWNDNNLSVEISTKTL